jgi:hypothetical protein
LSDEWDYFGSYKIPKTLDLNWIFRPYNAHHMFVMHLLLWIHYKVDALNFQIHQLTNFVLFNLFVACFFLIAYKLRIYSRYILIALALMYSCVAWEIHVWSTCNSFYVFYCFGLWGLYFATLPNPGLKDTTIGALLAVASIFSFGGGVAFGLTIVMAAAINALIYQGTNQTLKERMICHAPYVLVIITLIYWGLTYQVSQKFAPPVTLEKSQNFIPFFFTLMSGGFGMDWNLADYRLPATLGLIYCCVIAFGAIKLFISDSVDRQRKLFILSSIVVMIVLALQVSYGRSNGGVLQALTSRYRLFSLASFPLVFMLFGQNCFSKDVKQLCLFMFLVVNLLNLHTHINTFHYNQWHQLRENGERCLQKAYATKDYNTFCNLLYHSRVSLVPLVESAKNMGINFTKRFMHESIDNE